MKAVLLSLTLVAVPLLAMVHFANACPDPDFGCDPTPGLPHPTLPSVPHYTVCSELDSSTCGYNLVCVQKDGATVRCVRDPCGPPTVCFANP